MRTAYGSRRSKRAQLRPEQNVIESGNCLALGHLGQTRLNEVRGRILYTNTCISHWTFYIAVGGEFYCPPPPASVLVTDVFRIGTKETHPETPFFPHTDSYPPIDKATGEALGTTFIRFGTHAEAARSVDRDHGRKLGPANH